MKKIMTVGSALVALLTLSVVPVAGQDERPERPGMRRGAGIEAIMSLRERLELSDDQIAQLDALRAEAVERRSTERAALDEMRSRLLAGQIERSEMMAFMEERRDARGDEADDVRTRVDEILLPDQRTALEQYRAERRAYERGRRSGRREAGMRGRGGAGGRAFQREGRGARGFERGFRRGPRGPGGDEGVGESDPIDPGATFDPTELGVLFDTRDPAA